MISSLSLREESNSFLILIRLRWLKRNWWKNEKRHRIQLIRWNFPAFSDSNRAKFDPLVSVILSRLYSSQNFNSQVLYFFVAYSREIIVVFCAVIEWIIRKLLAPPRARRNISILSHGREKIEHFPTFLSRIQPMRVFIKCTRKRKEKEKIFSIISDRPRHNSTRLSVSFLISIV